MGHDHDHHHGPTPEGALWVAIVLNGAFLWNAPLADPIASVVIAVLILVGSMPLLRDTVRILRQRAPSDLDVKELCGVLEAEPSVRSVNDLHLWELDSGEPVLSC